jgi:hypothetical protein
MLAAGATSLALAGCKGLTALGSLPGPGPGVMELDHAIAAEAAMVATYHSALAGLAAAAPAGPAHARRARVRVGDLLATLLAEHEAHLTQMRSRLILPHRLAGATPSARPSAQQLPAEPRQLAQALAAAEQAAAARLLRQLTTVPAALAQLMASVGAAEAAHAALLTRPGPT